MFKTKKSRELLMNTIFGCTFYGSIAIFSTLTMGTLYGIVAVSSMMLLSYLILKFVEWVQDGSEEAS